MGKKQYTLHKKIETPNVHCGCSNRSYHPNLLLKIKFTDIWCIAINSGYKNLYVLQRLTIR